MIKDNLSWNINTEHICRKAKGRIWLLRRMMNLGLDHETILDVYFKEIRSVLEYGAVVFHSGLTNRLSCDIENVQKLVLHLLSNYLGLQFSYSEACIYFMAEPLSLRRISLCENFIRRNRKSDNCLFNKLSNTHNTRGSHTKFREYKCNSARFYNSPLVYLTRMANQTS